MLKSDTITSSIQNLIIKESPHRWHVLDKNQNLSFQPTSLNNYNFKDKKIAFLIVGLFSDPSSLKSLGQFLQKKDKYDYVFCFCYNIGEKKFLSDISNQLAEGLNLMVCHNNNSEEPHKIDIFAHSFGGLLIRHVLSNSSSENSQKILDTCKNIFFFGTPHKGIKPDEITNIAKSLCTKVTQDPQIKNLTPFMQLMGLSIDKLLSPNRILDTAKITEVYHHLIGETNLLKSLKPSYNVDNYYNIVGTNSNISLDSINLGSVRISLGNFIHEGYNLTQPNIITDGVVSKDSATLVPNGLDPSHELEINYDHNALVGINNRQEPNKVPKPIRQWINSIIKQQLLTKINLIDENNQSKEGILISNNAILFVGENEFQPTKIQNVDNIITSIKRFEDTNLYLALLKNSIVQDSFIDINILPTYGKINNIPFSDIDLNQDYIPISKNNTSSQVVFSQPENRFVGWISDVDGNEAILATAQLKCRQWINSTILENTLE